MPIPKIGALDVLKAMPDPGRSSSRHIADRIDDAADPVNRVRVVLNSLWGKGMVRRDGQLWSLTTLGREMRDDG